MPTARFQPSFAAGVLGPGLHGRVDIAKYDIGLKSAMNVFVHSHGGISNRAGTEFVCEVMDSAVEHRLLPFERDEDDNLILLLGDSLMQVIVDGAVVQSGGSDYSVATPYTASQIGRVDYVQSVDVVYLAHGDKVPQKMSRLANDNWTFDDINVDPTQAAPVISSVVAAGSGSKTYKYKVAAVVDGIESFPSDEASVTSAQDLSISGAQNTITFTGTADEFRIYRERNGVFGYIGFTDGTSFVDDNIDSDLTSTPVQAAGIMDGAGKYPRAVTLFQQRLVFANSADEPETIWASRIGAYENFTRSRILRDDDRIELPLSGQKLNAIRSMIQLRELLVFAASGEFSITGPDGVFVASNPIQTQYGYSGATSVKPLVVDDTALFVDGTGRSVRDLRYAFEQDGYAGNNLSIFASHLFEGKQIKAWAFCKSPFSVVWVCLDDGSLLSFTYEREHQVWAWCEHDVGGLVEDVASVREGNDDALYLIVKRSINGADVRYVERMRERQFSDVDDCFFVDCGLSYSGSPQSTFSGLDHLEGEDVVALADGNVIESLTVSSGSVTLPRAYSKVHVGLPFEASIETLPPAIDVQGLGNTRGRPHNISRLHVQMEKTRGIEAKGTGVLDYSELTLTGVDLAQKIEPMTGMAKVILAPNWGAGTLTIRQRYPLPMTILGINPELTVGQ